METYLYVFLVLGAVLLLWLFYLGYSNKKLVTIDKESKSYLVKYTWYSFIVLLSLLALVQGFLFLSHLLGVSVNGFYSNQYHILVWICIATPLCTYLYYEIKFYLKIVHKQDTDSMRWSSGIVLSFPYSLTYMLICTVFTYGMLIVYLLLFFSF